MGLKKIKNSLERLLSITLISSFLVSCGTNPKEESKIINTTPTYSENVYKIDPTSQVAECMSSLDLENNILYLSCLPESFEDSLNDNTILMMSGNNKIPSGFLGKIKSINKNVNPLEEQSNESSLISKSISLIPVPISEAIGNTEFSKDFSANKIFYLNHCFQNNFCVDGTLKMGLSGNISGKIEDFNFQNLYLASNLEKTLDLRVYSDYPANFKDNVNIVKHMFTPIITPSGITFVPYFNLSLDASVSSNSDLQFRVTKTDKSKIELFYENGGWFFDNSNNNQFDFITPELSMQNANAKVGAQVSAGLLVFGVAGAGLNGEAYASLTASPYSNPWWTLSAGLDLGFELKAGVFGYGIEYKKTIASLDKILVEADLSNLDLVLDVSKTSGFAPFEVFLDATKSNSFYSIAGFDVDCGSDFSSNYISWLKRSCLYENSGNFIAKATLTNIIGQTDSKNIVINVEQDPSEVKEYGEFIIDLRDNKSYLTKVFGNQKWMTKNLDYRSGSYLCYDNDSSNCDEYGALYNSFSSKSVCPFPWRLPNVEDWKYLATYLGFSPYNSGYVVSTQEKINNLFVGGNSGLDIQKGGSYLGNWDDFSGKNSSGKYWISSSGEFGTQTHLFFLNDSTSVKVVEGLFGDYNSVRCIKDN